MAEPQKVPLKQLWQTYRNQIILSFDNAKEIALKNFDEFANMLNESLEENKKLKDAVPPKPLNTSPEK